MSQFAYLDKKKLDDLLGRDDKIKSAPIAEKSYYQNKLYNQSRENPMFNEMLTNLVKSARKLKTEKDVANSTDTKLDEKKLEEKVSDEKKKTKEELEDEVKKIKKEIVKTGYEQKYSTDLLKTLGGFIGAVNIRIPALINTNVAAPSDIYRDMTSRMWDVLGEIRNMSEDEAIDYINSLRVQTEANIDKILALAESKEAEEMKALTESPKVEFPEPDMPPLFTGPEEEEEGGTETEEEEGGTETEEEEEEEGEEGTEKEEKKEEEVEMSEEEEEEVKIGKSTDPILDVDEIKFAIFKEKKATWDPEILENYDGTAIKKELNKRRALIDIFTEDKSIIRLNKKDGKITISVFKPSPAKSKLGEKAFSMEVKNASSITALFTRARSAASTTTQKDVSFAKFVDEIREKNPSLFRIMNTNSRTYKTKMESARTFAKLKNDRELLDLTQRLMKLKRTGEEKKTEEKKVIAETETGSGISNPTGNLQDETITTLARGMGFRGKKPGSAKGYLKSELAKKIMLRRSSNEAGNTLDTSRDDDIKRALVSILRKRKFAPEDILLLKNGYNKLA